MLNGESERVFSIAEEYRPIPGCVTAYDVYRHGELCISHVALGFKSESMVSHPRQPALYVCVGGELLIERSANLRYRLKPGDAMFTLPESSYVFSTAVGAVYTEILLPASYMIDENMKRRVLPLTKMSEQAGVLPVVETPCVSFFTVTFAAENEKELSGDQKCLVYVLSGEFDFTLGANSVPLLPGQNILLEGGTANALHTGTGGTLAFLRACAMD